VSIQVFLADEFLLNRSIIISIDDVYLRVSLIIITEDANPEPVIFSILFIIALAVSLGLGGYLYLYQKILKYPRPVRKVRKYRFSLKKKNPPDVKIIERETSFNNTYKEELMPASKFLRGKPSEPKITPEKLMKEKEIQKSQKNIGE